MPRIQAQVKRSADREAQNEIEDDEYYETVKEAYKKFLDDIRITIQHETSELLPKLRKGCEIYVVRFRHKPTIDRHYFVSYDAHDDLVKCDNKRFYVSEINIVKEQTARWIEKQCEINDDLFEYARRYRPIVDKDRHLIYLRSVIGNLVR